jgi:glycosyltransferase involved in cell wall biosynthesis
MKILLVNDHYSFGGAENYVQDLKEQLEQEHEVALLTLDGSSEPEYTVEESSNPLLKLRNRYFSNRKIKRQVREAVHDFEPEVVHLNKNVVAPIPVLKGLEDQNVVKTVHDFGYVSLDDKYAYGMNSWERKLRKFLDKGTRRYLKDLRSRVIKEYIAPSEALRQELEDKGYNPNTHLPNFVEDREPRFGGEHILFVGRLEKGKAPDLLIDAYATSEEDLPALELAGKGKMKEELERKVEEQGLSEKITVNGYVPDEELQELYKNALTVVIPSRWRENNPLVALEAKAYGSPLIVSDKGGLPELVEEGETGLVFESEDVGDLWEEISRNVDWEQLGKNSREDYEEKYTPGAHTEKLLETYSKAEENTE